jgi:hypothetical protein
VVSNNKVSTSTDAGNGTSATANQIATINGVRSAKTVGGNGYDTLSSTGLCNDVMTGGLGADKFVCGDARIPQGTLTVI